MGKIYFASIEDVDDIMQFIHNNWKNNHILSRDKNFFLYEHQDDKRVNFVCHRDSNNKLDGVLGFIKSSSSNSDIWTVIWQTLNSKEHPMLGIELFDFLRKSEDYNVLSSPGINKKANNIFKYLGIYTNHLKHFVLINNKITNYKIATIHDISYLQTIQFKENKKYNLKLLKEKEILFNFEAFKENIPYKDKRYFLKRYINHPIYNYDVYGIFENSEIDSLFVPREIRANNSKVLTIVDFIGKQKGFQFVSRYLYEKIIDEGYEYIDFMCFGYDEALLMNAGFHQVSFESSDLVIPIHFSPFVDKNIQINFFIDTNQLEKVRICKADGDQDRPS